MYADLLKDKRVTFSPCTEILSPLIQGAYEAAIEKEQSTLQPFLKVAFPPSRELDLDSPGETDVDIQVVVQGEETSRLGTSLLTTTLSLALATRLL